jgi:uncharacterized protein YlxP (DUF503 family)
MIIAALHLSLLVPGAGSLKAKRKAVLGLKDRVKARFEVAIAEVGAQDTWQRAELGAVAVGNDEAHLNARMDKLLAFIEGSGLVEVAAAQLEFIHAEPDLSEAVFPPAAKGLAGEEGR